MPDAMTSACMQCEQKFTTFVRKVVVVMTTTAVLLLW